MSFQISLDRTLSLENISTWSKNSLFEAKVPVFLVLGRSNVGKSSLLNALLNSKVARSGKTPGLTSFIQIFKISQKNGSDFYLADCPGYGFAAGGKKREKALQKLILTFLAHKSREVTCALLLMDLRRAPDKKGAATVKKISEIPDSLLENSAMDYFWVMKLFEAELPTLIIATKIDKIPKTKRKGMVEQMAGYFDIDAMDIFPVSSIKKIGINQLYSFLKTNFMTCNN